MQNDVGWYVASSPVYSHLSPPAFNTHTRRHTNTHCGKISDRGKMSYPPQPALLYDYTSMSHTEIPLIQRLHTTSKMSASFLWNPCLRPRHSGMTEGCGICIHTRAHSCEWVLSLSVVHLFIFQLEKKNHILTFFL